MALLEITEAQEYCGHMTMTDGSHVILTADERDALWAQIEAAKTKRATDMPDEKAAIEAMMQAHERLRELGWSDAIYCPKDGSEFNVIEAGSVGIFRCRYQGEWPTGSFMLFDDGDCYPSQPILYRLDPDAEAARKAKMAEIAERYRNAKLGQ